MQEENLERAYMIKREIQYLLNLKYLLKEEGLNILTNVTFEFKNGKKIPFLPPGVVKLVRRLSAQGIMELIAFKKEELKNLITD